MKLTNVLLTMYAVFETPQGTIGRAKQKTIGFTQDKEKQFVDKLIKAGNSNVHFGVRLGRVPKGELNRMTYSDFHG